MINKYFWLPTFKIFLFDTFIYFHSFFRFFFFFTEYLTLLTVVSEVFDKLSSNQRVSLVYSELLKKLGRNVLLPLLESVPEDETQNKVGRAVVDRMDPALEYDSSSLSSTLFPLLLSLLLPVL